MKAMKAKVKAMEAEIKAMKATKANEATERSRQPKNAKLCSSIPADERERSNHERECLEDYITQFDRLLRTYPIYENHKNVAKKMEDFLKNPEAVLCTLVGECQSGKTGCINAVARRWLGWNPNHNPANMYFFNSISANSLFEQWRDRVPQICHINMAKGINIKKFEKKLKNLRDAIIFVDECHYGAGAKQVLGKVFKEIGLKDLNYLIDNNIKIVQVSATPDGVLIDAAEWPEKNHQKFTLIPGENYIGIEKLKQRDQIRQYSFLKTKSEIEDLITFIIRTYDTARYHLIRAPNKRNDAYEPLKTALREWCDKMGWDFEEENSKIRTERKNRGESCESLLNDSYLNTQPTKHTLILLKNDLTAGKTLRKKHLGVIFDRKTTKVNDTFLIQGLAGRSCGYDGPDGLPKDAVLFTNLKTIDKYIDWLKEKSVKWCSATTKVYKGKTISKGTRVHHKNIKNLELTLPADQNRELQKGKYVNITPIFSEELMSSDSEQFKLVKDTIDYFSEEKRHGENVPMMDVVDWLVSHPKQRIDPKNKQEPEKTYQSQFYQMFRRPGLDKNDQGTSKGLLLYQEGQEGSNWFFRLNEASRD